MSHPQGGADWRGDTLPERTAGEKAGSGRRGQTGQEAECCPETQGEGAGLAVLPFMRFE